MFHSCGFATTKLFSDAHHLNEDNEIDHQFKYHPRQMARAMIKSLAEGLVLGLGVYCKLPHAHNVSFMPVIVET